MQGCGNKIGPYPCCTIVTGDALLLLPQIPTASVNMIIADPPYGSGGRDGSVHLETGETFGNRMGSDAYTWFVRQYAQELMRCSSPDAHCYVFTDWRKFVEVKIAFETVGWECRQLLVWDKGAGMGEYWRSSHEFILWMTKRQPMPLLHGSCFNVIRCGRTGRRDKAHPAQKPLKLIRQLIDASLPANALLLAPFIGSGTDGVAARESGGHFLGFEIDPDVAERARERVRNTQPPLFVMQPDQEVMAI